MCNITKEKQLEQLDVICKFYTNGTSKRLIRHDFFKNIQTEIQAYLLGFYVADGSLNLQRNTIRIKINSADSEIIKLFNIYISPEALIKVNKETKQMGANNKEITIKENIQIDISSKVLSESLQDLGYGERKTYKCINLPNIDKSLIRHFIRGYFDGDGCITYSVREPNLKNREKNPRLVCRFEIAAKTDSLIKDIQEVLTESGISTNINYLKSSDSYRLYSCSREQIINIFNYLYKDSNFYLSRKFNKFNYYANTEKIQIITELRNA